MIPVSGEFLTPLLQGIKKSQLVFPYLCIATKNWMTPATGPLWPPIMFDIIHSPKMCEKINNKIDRDDNKRN